MIAFWNISSANVTLIWGMLWVTVVFNLSRGCGLAMLKINLPTDYSKRQWGNWVV
ncbi:MAG: hypothetical protein ACJA0M_000019 [Chitinophagales bacterium]|jgi:hypothetical protein